MRIAMDLVVYSLSSNGEDMPELLYIIKGCVDNGILDIESAIMASKTLLNKENCVLLLNHLKKNYLPLFVPNSVWNSVIDGLPYFEYDREVRKQEKTKEEYTTIVYNIDTSTLDRVDKFILSLLKNEYIESNEAPNEVMDDVFGSEEFLNSVLSDTAGKKKDYRLVYENGSYYVKEL